MSARITIQSGIAAGTSHLIEGRVARVGSDPQSEVCLPTSDIPSHALTLEFRDDGCLVYNRCSASVYVGAHVVEPDHVVQWPETDILQLGKDTELLLDFDLEVGQEIFADDNQLDSAVESGKDGQATSEQNKANSSASSKTAIQSFVTVACLFGCVLLLLRDQNRKAATETGPGFADIVSKALAESEISRELILRFQHAEAQRIRGRSEVAYDEFKLIRDDLLANKDRSARAANDSKSEILQLMQQRISELQH